jgi:hypothetical protein
MIQLGRIRLAGRRRGSEVECISDFGGKARRKETTTKVVECGDMDWIDLAQNWGQWRPLVKTVWNFEGQGNVREILSG